MVKKNVRQMKVYGQSGYRYEETPTIMLKGKWLKELGFEIGNYISINCEDGKLIITIDEEKAKMVEAENAFMERETKALKKRFEQEKAKLHQKYVAECSAGYVADKEIVD